MAKVGVLRDPETKEQYFPITVADAVIGLTPGGSVTVTGTSPIAVSNNVVSIDNAYGDTKNPYGTKSANTFLAGPTSGNAAVPSFRTLTINDIQTPLPDLYAIESLTGTSGLLKKTAANTWELDTHTYLTSHQTIYALTLQAAGVIIGSTWNPASAAATLNIPVYSVDSSNLGVAGLVPTATAAQTAGNYYLKADGTWSLISDGPSGLASIKVDGMTSNSNGVIARTFFVSASGSTAAKSTNSTASTIGTLTLEDNAHVRVHFDNANTASNPTLNVASTGAKNIWVDGVQITTGAEKYYLKGTVDFVYSAILATQGWHIIGKHKILGGATASVAGSAGIVPAPAAGDNEKFLCGDGTWQTVSSGSNGTVTQVTASSGLNTTSGDTTTDGGTITTNGTLHLTKCNNNAGSFGPNSDASPAAGGTFAVPNITVDKWGRVTAASDKTITLPNSGGGGGSSTKNMAAYDLFGPVTDINGNAVSLTPVHFLTALIKPILDDSASNDVSIITSDALVSNDNGSADGHLPIGALILLYAGYLHILGYSYGRIVVDSAGHGDYSGYFIGHDDGASWGVNTNLNSGTVLQGIHAKVVFFNWDGIDDTTGLPLGPSDYNTTNTRDTSGQPLSATANEHHFNRYTFTFSSIVAGSDIYQLTDILDDIKNESDVTATTNFENLIKLCETLDPLSPSSLFDKMVVTVEHRSVRSYGYHIFS